MATRVVFLIDHEHGDQRFSPGDSCEVRILGATLANHLAALGVLRIEPVDASPIPVSASKKSGE